MSAVNKEIVQRFYEEVENQGKLELLDQFIAPDFKDAFNSSALGPAIGREGMKQMIVNLRKRPDFHVVIEDLIAEGDKVVVRMPGVVEILRIADHQITERWVIIDRSPNPG